MKYYTREDFPQPSPVDTERLRNLKDVPEELAGILDAYDAAFEIADEADSGREEAEAELADAETVDAEALRAALMSGQPDPGTAGSDAAHRAAIVAQERLRLARTTLRAAEDKVWNVIKANKTAMLRAAIAAEIGNLDRMESAAQKAVQEIGAVARIGGEAGRTYNVVAYYAGAKEGVTVNPNWPSMGEIFHTGKAARDWYQFQLDHTHTEAER